MAAETILVTAASSGLGSGIVTGLAAPGRHLIVHFNRDEGGARTVAEKAMNQGATANVVRADLTSVADTARMKRQIEEDHDHLDVLVNNFGPYIRARWDEYTDEQWAHQLEGTVTATHRVTRDLIELLRAAPAATVVNFADAAADRITAHPSDLPYYIGKVGVVQLTKTIAVEEARHGITANAVMPGVMENSEIKPETDRIPAGRFGTPHDLVEVIEYLIGARYVTGSTIQMGGGWRI